MAIVPWQVFPFDTEKFEFKITFRDACRDATPVSQTIAFPAVTWQTDLTSSYDVPAYTDSLDGGSYALGVCGEKRLTLDSDLPAYLTVAYANDPITGDFTFNYDQAPVLEADAGQSHTVSYTVTLQDYAGIAPTMQDTFDIEIKCSQTYTEDAFSLTQIDFDLLLEPATFTLPTVSDIPT